MCIQRLMVRVGQIPVVKDGLALLFPSQKTDWNICCCCCFKKDKILATKIQTFFKTK